MISQIEVFENKELPPDAEDINEYVFFRKILKTIEYIFCCNKVPSYLEVSVINQDAEMITLFQEPFEG